MVGLCVVHGLMCWWLDCGVSACICFCVSVCVFVCVCVCSCEQVATRASTTPQARCKLVLPIHVMPPSSPSLVGHWE